jgi:hypothetical protein
MNRKPRNQEESAANTGSRSINRTADQFCTESVTKVLYSREESSKRGRNLNSPKGSNLNTCFMTFIFHLENQTIYLCIVWSIRDIIREEGI